jgi:hypothetical protein
MYERFYDCGLHIPIGDQNVASCAVDLVAAPGKHELSSLSPALWCEIKPFCEGLWTWLRTFLITLVCAARQNGHQNADPIAPNERAADPGRNLLRGALFLDKDGVSI